MSMSFSYRHLYYFWVTAKEGGMGRAAARLDMAVQTVSSQVHELERSLGQALFKPAGRGLALTEAGEAALRQAEQIFQLGEQLPLLVRDAANAQHVRLAVGIADGLPKLVVRRLLDPVMSERHLKLLCLEREFDTLLADLALHRLDVVLADRPAPSNANLRLYSQRLGSSPVGWYASSALHAKAKAGFPASLGGIPLLLPTGHGVVRGHIDRWFEKNGLTPNIAAEFEDSALLKTFGSSGMGAFPAASLVHDDMIKRYGVKLLGMCEGVEEHYYAIGTQKKVVHPLVARLLPGNR
jgi:LysR family transcriptional activator of nhaA